MFIDKEYSYQLQFQNLLGSWGKIMSKKEKVIGERIEKFPIHERKKKKIQQIKI